ncbi:single stranded DNA-binding domain-containing protein [Kitasatospora purpeofusca]|uniref:hypothetical protein n=1 Tax=Kitasatospora purpeofusca TaxID=67352 RepID=UPI0037F41CD1
MPALKELPEGPRRKFVTELHVHYRVANRPNLQAIADAAALAPEGRAVSRETVRRLLTGKGNATWTNVDLVFRTLCQLAGEDPERLRWEQDRYDDDATTCRDHLRKLWHDSIDDEDLGVEPPPRSAPDPQPQTGGFGGQQHSGWGASSSPTYDDPWASPAPANGKFTEEPPF